MPQIVDSPFLYRIRPSNNTGNAKDQCATAYCSGTVRKKDKLNKKLKLCDYCLGGLSFYKTRFGKERVGKLGRWKDLFVGVELEFNHKKRKPLSEDLICHVVGVGITSDGSLGTEGIEVQTPKLKGREINRTIRSICKLASKGNVSYKCGLHVHVDAKQLTRLRALKFAKLMTFGDEVLRLMISSSRRDNQYCYPLSDDFDLSDIGLRTKLSSIMTGKYCGTNFNAMNEHGTIEFRHHPGTLNPDEILKWTELCQSLVYCAIKGYKSSFIKTLSNISDDGNRAKVFLRLVGVRPAIYKFAINKIREHNPTLNV